MEISLLRVNGMGDAKYYSTIFVLNFESFLHPLPYAVTMSLIYFIHLLYTFVFCLLFLPEIYFHLYT